MLGCAWWTALAAVGMAGDLITDDTAVRMWTCVPVEEWQLTCKWCRFNNALGASGVLKKEVTAELIKIGV